MQSARVYSKFDCENMIEEMSWRRAALSSEATYSLQYYSCDRNAWTIEIGHYYTAYVEHDDRDIWHEHDDRD